MIDLKDNKNFETLEVLAKSFDIENFCHTNQVNISMWTLPSEEFCFSSSLNKIIAIKNLSNEPKIYDFKLINYKTPTSDLFLQQAQDIDIFNPFMKNIKTLSNSMKLNGYENIFTYVGAITSYEDFSKFMTIIGIRFLVCGFK